METYRITIGVGLVLLKLMATYADLLRWVAWEVELSKIISETEAEIKKLEQFKEKRR